MTDLEYQKSNGNWPIKALAENAEFIFSGNFNDERIHKEEVAIIFEWAQQAVLVTLALAGLLAFGLAVYQAARAGQPWFLLNHNFSNLMFWAGCFAAAYWWAKRKQKNIETQGLNLLHFGQAGGGKPAEPFDLYTLFSPEAKKVWAGAYEIAKKRSRKPEIEVNALDLFLSLTQDQSIRQIFIRLGVNPGDVQTFITNFAELKLAQSGESLEKIPFVAFTESLKLHNRRIDPLMLFCALALVLPPKHIIQAILFNIDLNIEKLEILAAWIFNLKVLREDYQTFKKLARLKPDSEINHGLTSLPTPYLNRFSQDLTRYAKHGALPLALGRGPDLTEIFRLAAQNNNSLIIKGTEGSGRTTVVNELAYKMVTEQVPKQWQDKRLVKLELAAIVGNLQKAESALVSALNEAAAASDIILVLEEIHELAKIQGSSGLNLLEVLISFLQNHSLQVIGTTTPDAYVDFLQDSPNIESTFSTYELMNISQSGILLACCVRASLLEGQNKCYFLYPAIEQAVQLTDLYVKGVSQPQKAIAVLVEAAAKAKTGKNKLVTPGLVQKIVSQKTHIPTNNFTQDEAEKLLNLEQQMSKFIVGQSAAITAVAEGLRRARSGLSEAGRPLASFLFLGPTGVGKTEIAKTLAREYFGEEKFLLRLDMSEYRGANGMDKLLGQAESKTDTPLVKHLKNYPFCLLLVDEFEKASPEIANLFLQILEDGRLTSGRGEVLDLTHSLVIATSNAGTKEIQEGLQAGKTLEQIKMELFSRILVNSFPPELLNRFDSIILFNPLSHEEVQRITYLQLQYLIAKLLAKGVKLDFTQNVVNDIAHSAFDPLLGARPIRRYIQDHVEGFLAKLLLKKQLERGTEVTIDLKDGQLVVK